MRECALDAGLINEKGSRNLKFTTEREYEVIVDSETLYVPRGLIL